MQPRALLLPTLLAATTATASSCQAQTTPADALPTVEASTKPGTPWKAYPTRTLAELPAGVTAQTDASLDRYGGRTDKKAKATGFFYPTKIGDRWWLVDPDGGLFIDKAVVSVSPSSLNGEALKAKYGDEAGWAKSTDALLQTNGFNGTGAWTSNELLQAQSPRPVYTVILSFMSSYGKQRGGTFQQPGHTGYPKDCIFVFDPKFEAFCDTFAQQVAANQNDPYLLGTFSDNELPWKRTALRNYLSFDATDPGHIAAQAWLRNRHGETATAADITAQDEADFLNFVADRYYRLVSTALKKYDPHHLYLGSRLHGGALSDTEVVRAAGKYVDVLAVNYYGSWTPNPEKMTMWATNTGKPFLVTEWYAKGADSGMGNTGGAGWLVKTQADRGKFYQNFTLGLLGSKQCVGWQWFKYADNDPNTTTADPSNQDSNKGIVTARYEPYGPLIEAMRQLNTHLYGLIDYFDKGAGK